MSNFSPDAAAAAFIKLDIENEWAKPFRLGLYIRPLTKWLFDDDNEELDELDEVEEEDEEVEEEDAAAAAAKAAAAAIVLDVLFAAAVAGPADDEDDDDDEFVDEDVKSLFNKLPKWLLLFNRLFWFVVNNCWFVE